MSRVELPIFQDPNSNPCLDQCPQSSCCKDMFFLYLNPDELSRLTENAYKQESDSVLDLPTKNELKFLPNGVYYSKRTNENNYVAVVAGPCAKLDEKGECTIYEDRPIACKRFSAGSKDCESTRKRDGLQAVKIV